MNRASSRNRHANWIFSANVTSQQLRAIILVFAMIFPVVAPVPAWAYDLNLPAPLPQAEVGEPVLAAPQSGWLASRISTLATAVASFLIPAGAVKDPRPGESTPSLPALAKRVTEIKTELQPETHVMVGQTISLAALPIDKKGAIVDGVRVQWMTANRRSLKIVGDSQAIAVKEGEATLIATAGDALREFKITVEAAKDSASAHVLGKGKTVTPPVAPPPPPPTEEMFINSLFNAQNNLGNPPGQVEQGARTEAAAMRTRERVGSSNFSFGLPLASLPGRGIDASVGITYNSRMWTKVPRSNTNDYYYNIDRNWALAPGFMIGYGYLDNYVSGGTSPSNYTYRFSLVGPDGTRTELAQKSPPGNWRVYESTDGSFIQLETWAGGEASDQTLTLKYPDGTVVTFGARTPDEWQQNPYQGRRYPIKIVDRNGNTISISYRQNDTWGRIATITDTLGRYINFEYNASGYLVAITVPPLVDNQPRRQVARFYYASLPFEQGNRFSDGNWTYAGFDYPSAVVLQYVYFPGTSSGYKFDYSSAWGVMYKISNLRGMLVSTLALDETGYVGNEGTAAATTTYNYPLTLNATGQPAPLTDAPKFTTRTDQWLPDNTAHVTVFSTRTSDTGSHKITSITAPDSTISESWTALTGESWQIGLVTDTYIKTPGGQFGDPEWSHTKMVWENQTGTPGRSYPRVIKVEQTNDARQMKPTTIEYDSYNNPTVVREFDYGVTVPTAGNELRKTETTYVTGGQWTGRHLFSLPSAVRSWTNGILSSRTEYTYDGAALTDYNEEYIVGLEPGFNPDSPPECHLECPMSCQDPNHPPCACEPENVCTPVYDASSDYRGNVTKVTSWANPSDDNDPDKSVHDFTYDIAGNVLTATLSCCNLKTIQYDSTYHAYPIRVTKGASPLQLTTETDYSFGTGLPIHTRDENNQQTDFTYDANTLRQTRVDFPNDGWATNEWNDSTFPYHIRTTSSIDSSKSISSWAFYDGASRQFRTRTQTANGYLSNDAKFDTFGRAIGTFSPYTVAGLTDARPSGVNSTSATQIDPLGRVLQMTYPDGTTTSVDFNSFSTTPTNFGRTFATIKDQALKERRQVFDALGRLVRVDEPGPNGVGLGSVSSPNQPTVYEYDGNDNLTKVTQAGTVTQERLFKYDGLSRLTHERQVEANATLNNVGEKVSSGGLWTGFYKYTTDGLLDFGVDARGVKTDFTYDGLNRVVSVAYTGESGYSTPNVTYTYSGSDPGFLNVGRLTKIQTAENVGQGTPATEQNYSYDEVGQVKKHTQTINGQAYQLLYSYNYAGQLVSETYPSGRVVTNTVDNFGTLQTIADSQRTYLNGVTINNQGQLSQVALGNGTTETFTYNDRFQMTSQSLLKSSTVLQKYDYSFGEVTTSTGSVDTAKNNGQLGKIESWIGSSKQWSQRFGYDELGRLKEAREHRGDNDSLTYKQIFDYDRFGNLYRKAASNPTTGQSNPLAYTPIEDTDINKSKNQFATGTTYDDAGQVTVDNKFRGMGFSYDANGRQVKATRTNTPDASTVYDGLGNRVATKINGIWEYMIYDAYGKLVAEYGVADTGSGGVSYVQQDWQGSVRTVTNGNGYVVSRTDHQAFGDKIPSGVGLRSVNQGYLDNAGTRQGYALTENDYASGQQHTRHRKLETQGGRWSSADPYNGSMELADPQSFNRYSYVRGEPTNYVDPSGLEMRICEIHGGELQCSTVGGWGYSGAQNNYETSNALAGGFFGDHVRGYLERTHAEQVLANDHVWQVSYFLFTAAFLGFLGDDIPRYTPVDRLDLLPPAVAECIRNVEAEFGPKQAALAESLSNGRGWSLAKIGGLTSIGFIFGGPWGSVGALFGGIIDEGLDEMKAVHTLRRAYQAALATCGVSRTRNKGQDVYRKI